MSLPSLLNPQNPKFLFLPVHHSSPHKLFSIQTIKYPTKFFSFPPSLQSLSPPIQNDDVGYDDDDRVIGDCLVFEEGIFEDPYLETESSVHFGSKKEKARSKRKKRNELEIETENLVPDKWREAQAEINITKKERRKIAQEMQLNSRIDKKKKALLPIRSLNLEEYKAYKEAKLAQLKPLVLDNPKKLNFKEEKENPEIKESERVSPKNPRWAVYGKGFDDVTEFFSSGNYEPGAKKSEGPRKLFSKEEKVLLNKKIPDLSAASSSKWLPLQTLAASGEFYLMDALLKHNVDINALNVNGLTALHKAIICKKQAITSYLLRESANPFVQDSEGATLLHYAVQTASAPAIKLLLLYNVDINLQDKYGWTPLHVAVQAQRTDIVKLLLIKGADREFKNQDGLTPLDLCLYSGETTRVYELIKLLKQYPTKRTVSRAPQ